MSGEGTLISTPDADAAQRGQRGGGSDGNQKKRRPLFQWFSGSGGVTTEAFRAGGGAMEQLKMKEIPEMT